MRLAPHKPLGSHSIVALIPARAGSKRIPGKNTKDLGGKPLLWWTLELAVRCDLFSSVIVSSDSADTLKLAEAFLCERHYRKAAHGTDTAPDFLWVNEVMKERTEDIFCILRPTSPFRTESTIRRAYAKLVGGRADSVRAVEKVTQHPGKMWRVFEGASFMYPLLDQKHPDGTPWHSSPTQTLPTVYMQNASLEMAWTYVLKQYGTIHGLSVAPFLTGHEEGFDLNTPDDWARAEQIAATWSR